MISFSHAISYSFNREFVMYRQKVDLPTFRPPTTHTILFRPISFILHRSIVSRISLFQEGGIVRILSVGEAYMIRNERLVHISRIGKERWVKFTRQTPSRLIGLVESTELKVNSCLNIGAYFSMD